MTQLTCLITGANRGIGFAFCKAFKEKGYKVIGTSRSLEAATELKTLGVDVVLLDVADTTSILSLKERLPPGPIHLLINNAGILDKSHTESVTCDTMHHVFQVNSGNNESLLFDCLFCFS